MSGSRLKAKVRGGCVVQQRLLPKLGRVVVQVLQTESVPDIAQLRSACPFRAGIMAATTAALLDHLVGAGRWPLQDRQRDHLLEVGLGIRVCDIQLGIIVPLTSGLRYPDVF